MIEKQNRPTANWAAGEAESKPDYTLLATSNKKIIRLPDGRAVGTVENGVLRRRFVLGHSITGLLFTPPTRPESFKLGHSITGLQVHALDRRARLAQLIEFAGERAERAPLGEARRKWAMVETYATRAIARAILAECSQ